MSSSTSASGRCPECGAELAAGQARCWLCQRHFHEPAGENPYASPRPISEQSAAQFSLASLFLVVTLVAVWLGVFLLAPGLSILLAVFATPAAIRTMITSSYRRTAGAALTPLQKLGAFLISLLLMAVIGLATFVAFQVVCWSGAFLAQGNETYPNLLAGVVCGLIGAAPVLIWLLWATRPSKEAIMLEQRLQRRP
jgi:hypothetical protein